MCDLEGKLIAWLDGELRPDEAAAVGLHLQGCAECRSRAEAFRRMSGAFEQYCDAHYEVAAASRGGKCVRRTLAISAVAAVAAAMVLAFLLAPRLRVTLGTAPLQASTPSVSDVAQAKNLQSAPPVAATAKPVSREGHPGRAPQVKQAAAPPQTAGTSFIASQPAVEIAIPAEAIFPPGAVPEGVGFTADVTFAPDGSAQQIRLQPQLTEFERRPSRP